MKQSQDELFFTEKLFDILKEMYQYNCCNKEKLLEKYVSMRLQVSLNNYYSDLLSGFDSLKSFDSNTVMKKLLKDK